MVKSTSDDFSRDDIFPPLVLLRNKFPPEKKYTVICEFCISEYIFKRKGKGFANFDFDSTSLNANFLYVRLDKDNVSLSNPAERGEVQGGKSPSSLNLVQKLATGNTRFLNLVVKEVFDLQRFASTPTYHTKKA